MNPQIVNYILYGIVVLAGMSVSLQQVLNSSLRTTMSSPVWAGFVSYLAGAVFMLIAGLASGLPSVTSQTILKSPVLPWFSGLFGVVFVMTAIFMVPRLGVATVISLIVLGQMIGSLTFDHFGLFGLPEQPINFSRVLGVAFLLLGVVLIRR